MRKGKHDFKAPAFQLYAKEFLQDEAVIAMDLDAVGAYVVLLCHQWNEGSIPAEISLQARICRISPDRMNILWPQVSPKFTVVKGRGDRLVNPKLETVRRERERFSRKQADSGTLGALKKWTNKSLSNSNLDGLPQANAIATPLGFDGSGSGTGSVYTPLTPLSEGNGADAPLLVCPPGPGERSKRKPKEWPADVERIARSIHARHPANFERRDCSVNYIAECLVKILKHHRIQPNEQAAYLEKINAIHEGWCASGGWTDDDGRFAKGLRNYLAVTEERYSVEPDAPTRKAPVRLMA